MGLMLYAASVAMVQYTHLEVDSGFSTSSDEGRIGELLRAALLIKQVQSSLGQDLLSRCLRGLPGLESIAKRNADRVTRIGLKSPQGDLNRLLVTPGDFKPFQVDNDPMSLEHWVIVDLKWLEVTLG
ncbi:hypothetical protein DPMN_036632 [Dreissena polymorpha]|uniref:Uncharacterized protein n=1 Tax=Dreissena polymorpha TaxID=45954 RepID=A0A9D4M9H2_DREPO|nr:hypothetical protein DPMN_036632 [Dreissena polymorpha]